MMNLPCLPIFGDFVVDVAVSWIVSPAVSIVLMLAQIICSTLDDLRHNLEYLV